MSKTTFSSVASALYRAFEKAKRDSNGEEFTRLKEGSPQWMKDAIFAAHEAIDSRLPDDWIYEMVRCLASDLEDRDLDEGSEADSDMLHEIADSQVEIYTSALAQWYADHSGNRDLCEEAVSEGLASESASIEDRIKVGQFMAIERILGSLVESLESQRETEDEANAETANA